MSTIGENVKQQTLRTGPTLSDLMYLIANDKDYRVSLQSIKDLFNIEESEIWKTKEVASGITGFITLEDSTIYGAIEIEYLAKRTGRGYTTGLITLLVDSSITSGVSVSNFQTVSRNDGDDLGLTMDYGRLSGGLIQLDISVNASDANPVILNYRVKSKRLITIS